MNRLKDEYGEKRGWRMCGPASIVLSRILSEKTGVPIGRDLEGEHIELAVGIYDPKNMPDRVVRMEEQTYVRYYPGNGTVYYIDAIYGLLMGGRQDLAEAIQVEQYPVDQVDQQLTERHNLYPFNPNHEDLAKCKTFASMPTSELRAMYYNDSVAALNDERATMADYIADSGHAMQTDCSRTEKIIKEFAPSWDVDPLRKIKRLQELTQHIMAQSQESVLSKFGRPLTESMRFQPGREVRSEIIYNDQAPRVENWSVPSKPKEEVLTFHVDGLRYVLKDGEKLQIFFNGSSREITHEMISKLLSAAQGNNEVESFLQRNTETLK
jgi:hypothetical protein